MVQFSQIAGVVDDDLVEAIVDRSHLLGSGVSRAVYAAQSANDLVVKEMSRPFPHANMVEWIVWGAVEKMSEDYMNTTANPDMMTRFARCHAISLTGKFLVMERLFPLDKDDVFSRGAFPPWLNDVKPATAFGRDTSFGKDAIGLVKVMDYAEVNFYDVLNPLNWERRL